VHQPGGLKSKIKSLAELKQIVLELKEQGKRIVFTNGCFDLFHVGHASVFREAKKLGDVLIVAVNSDRSVRALKGHKRPLIAQEQRLELVASLESVDYAVMFHELDPLKII
jgi:rfaE bifunctional protein nucleotidyltransferase chain/domain